MSFRRLKWQYHMVFIQKYRKKVLYGKIREDVREIIRILCKDVEIIVGAVFKNHVHLSVAIPPKLSISNFMGECNPYHSCYLPNGKPVIFKSENVGKTARYLDIGDIHEIVRVVSTEKLCDSLA